MGIGRASSDGDLAPNRIRMAFVSVASNEKVTQSCDFPYLVKQYEIRSGLVTKSVKILKTQNKEKYDTPYPSR